MSIDSPVGRRRRDLGMKFTREWAPEHLLRFARETERAGFDELWLVEDLGFHGGFAPCGAVLAATDHVRVGLGIAPAVVRNAAYMAMEVASLARLFPGRFHMGLGHGVDFWVEQVGATPASWMGSLRETTEATRRLLSGGAVSYDGEFVQLDGVELWHPGSAPVSLGVRGPKGMAMAGQVADGVIFAELSGPRYVARVRREIGESAQLTVFVHASTNADNLRAILEERLALTRFAGQLVDYADAWPTDPSREFGVLGPFETWAEQAERWFAAGADCVVFCPPPSDDPSEIAAWTLDR